MMKLTLSLSSTTSILTWVFPNYCVLYHRKYDFLLSVYKRWSYLFIGRLLLFSIFICHLFKKIFSKYLSTCSVPGIVPGAKDIAVNETDENLCPDGTQVLAYMIFKNKWLKCKVCQMVIDSMGKGRKRDGSVTCFGEEACLLCSLV